MCSRRPTGDCLIVTDIMSTDKRSAVMASIRARGNKTTEIAFMKLLRKHHVSGWRRHLPLALPKSAGGKQSRSKFRSSVTPDFVFPCARVAVFIDGCFWHGCPRHGVTPAANGSFWQAKLAANRARDRRVNRELRRQKWTVLRIWEHQLLGSSRLVEHLRRKIG
jgi:DNA mismatch endonuclease (patch repair protein)